MFSEDIGFEIRKLHLIIKREFDKLGCENNKPTRLQLAILMFVHQNTVNKKPTYQKDIEKEFEVRASTVTEILRKMENDDLIKKISEDHDARLKRIVATKKAENIQQTLRTRFITLRETMKKGLTNEEVTQYIAITKKIQKNLIGEYNAKNID